MDIESKGAESAPLRVEEEQQQQPTGAVREQGVDRMLYGVDERPPWPTAILLALQQFLTMFASTVSLPMLMSGPLCMSGDTVGVSQLISTVLFVAGVGTLLQVNFGVRLPIIQSISASFANPFIAFLSLPKWKCPGCATTLGGNYNGTAVVECGSEPHKALWEGRLRELQGAIMVSSVVQMFLGFSGLVGFLLNYIGPLTITTTIALIGLSLFDLVAIKSQSHWWISLATLVLIVLFSQHLRKVTVPFCTYKRTSERPACSRSSLRCFALFPILIAISLSWLLCFVLTELDVLPSQPGHWGYGARTDTKLHVLSRAPWFSFPYPGQWGTPTVSVSGILSGLAAITPSIVESVGDYYACARVSGAPPPPKYAVSRGIGIEGVTCMVAGAWGSSGGLTSYSQNTGAIGITKFSAVFVAIPDPIVGGLFFAMFGMVTGVGLSNLQYVDLSSSRNLLVLGVSLFTGLTIPKWLSHPANAHAISTGSSEVDQVLTVLFSTSTFVGGVVAFILDNTIPGTREERGLVRWRAGSKGISGDLDLKLYDLPFIQGWFNKRHLTNYLPFCPGFRRGEKRNAPVSEHTMASYGKHVPSCKSSHDQFSEL
ncbi:hypothetical protein BaRGS_00038455 [Batillaria attramentaria]|uniref:Uncharacterized protein n=1 Tax=Batillaria attramentaria TaxID=370345 RepID=A0ABD0J5L9_9CAEN